MAIAVEVHAFPSGDDAFDFTGEGTASFEFLLDFGDRDGDGLLDSWEEEGIDFTGPGIEIDLPGLGADPDKKDVFVELDVMQTVSFDPQIVDDVVEAFAQAPASMVDNPDGSPGIQLHVIIDGDRPPLQEVILVDQGSGPPLSPDFYAIKDSFFGSAADRSHPDWDDLRRAKLWVFRYCLWTHTLHDNNDDYPWGVSEGIPSNDLVIAAARMQGVSWLANVLSDAIAGVFMHELGHTLGLDHGGQDGTHHKPNYLSVMNYSYVIPWDRTTNQGTNAKAAWHLDFSRTEVDTLNEQQLVEGVGLNGPPGRRILFNSEPSGDPPKRNIGWANANQVDWNNSSTIEPDPSRSAYETSMPSTMPVARTVSRTSFDGNAIRTSIRVRPPGRGVRTSSLRLGSPSMPIICSVVTARRGGSLSSSSPNTDPTDSSPVPRTRP